MFGIIVSGQPRCGKSTLVKSLHSNSEILSCNVDAKILVKILSKKIDRKISLKISFCVLVHHVKSEHDISRHKTTRKENVKNLGTLLESVPLKYAH